MHELGNGSVGLTAWRKRLDLIAHHADQGLNGRVAGAISNWLKPRECYLGNVGLETSIMYGEEIVSKPPGHRAKLGRD